MTKKVKTLSIQDELGIHNITDEDCCVKCKSCKVERDLRMSDVGNKGVNPKKCKCGGTNQFRYWLDSIYTEEEYEKLVSNLMN